MKTIIQFNRSPNDKLGSKRFHQGAGALLFMMLLVFFNGLFSGGALAAVGDPDNVSFTLEGCNNNGTVRLPNGSGQFICEDSIYTTGNLGKGWNELDLVPYRLTADAGNSAPVSQTYTIAVVLDNKDAAKPGYDVLSTPVLNTAKSSGSCTAANVGAETLKIPGIGGISESRYRLVTITQTKNTTCVYDYYGRLALGSHLFPGSSLHANLTNQDLGTAGIGARDVSIPVKELSPQELRKDMTALQNADHAWNLTKAANPSSIAFGDVCATDTPASKDVTFTVKWEKLAATPTGITVVTNIYAKNPAAREITVKVTDKIYKGSGQSGDVLHESSTPDNGVLVPANTELNVLTHTATLPTTTGNFGDFLNDVATATYTDLVTGITVPGQTTAAASAQITQGTITNTSADITDSELITGKDLTFSVASPSVGVFTNYTAGVPTVGPVDWQLLNQIGDHEVNFSKTIYLDGKRITTGTLTDTANLVGSTGFKKTAGPIKVDISSSASVKLAISKTIPNVLDTGEKIDVVFHISRSGDSTYSQDETFSFVAGGPTTQTIELTGLVPDSYTVAETGSTFYPAGCSSSACSLTNPLTPDNSSQTADLSVGTDGIVSKCSASLAFENKLRQDKLAKVNVAKTTFPGLSVGDADYNWTFTLKPIGITAIAGANAAAVLFGGNDDPQLLAEGSYTVTETARTGWDLTNVFPGSIANGCTFAVDYPEDYDRTFACTFTNTKRGKVQVDKTVSGSIPTGTQEYTFQIREQATTSSDGTTLETQLANASNGGLLNFTTLLKPGTYQMCEVVMPGWNTNLGTYGTLFVPNSMTTPILPNPNVNNMTVCIDFTVSAGETKKFAVDNAPPPGGRGLTIGFWKNWASCTKGGQKPVLDQTMAKATPPGIQVGTFYLVGNPSNRDLAPDCNKAVNLLNKSTFGGKKMASDPLFNMTAQLVAAELNLKAGAYSCPNVVLSIQSANNLLIKYKFTGDVYGKLSAADANSANTLATTLDNYNNNRTGVCQ